RLGAEFNIDGGTSGGLEEVRSAARVDGSFAVAWSTTSGSFPDASPVAARLFQPDATPATAATQVNTATEGRQFEADITALVNGQFLVAWSNLSASGDELSVRSLAANGLPVGSQTQVTQASQGLQSEPSLSADRGDRSVLVWNDSRARILARRIDSSGALLGSEFEVSQGGPGDRSTPSVATFRDGGFVVVWTDTAGPVPEADGGIVARVFDRNDFGGPAFVVNAQTSGTQRRPSVVADSRGRFRVSWGTDGQEIAARSFQSTTQIQTGQLVSGRTFSRSTGEHWVYYTFQVPAGQTSLVATLSDLPDFSPNDADLYLRQGAPPTELVSDCSSTFAGNSLERCVIANPIAGEWWVGVRGWSGGAVDFKLFVDLPFFSDDFESGSTSGWSSSSP
ncbi:MAG: PPC domain-containing protein, partial [Acidobacteriota bacterium]